MRTISNLDPMIQKILSLTLVDVVDECRSLLAALLLCNPDECTIIQAQYSKDAVIEFVLDSVGKFRSDDSLMALYINDGFFTEQLELLLETAKGNAIFGARLMPVFCAALTDAEVFKLPVKLERKIIRHIEWQRQHDGFAITEVCANSASIVYADDVTTAACTARYTLSKT